MVREPRHHLKHKPHWTAFGVHESTRLRDFPAGSFLRTAILAGSRQLLDRPQAWEVDGLGIHIV